MKPVKPLLAAVVLLWAGAPLDAGAASDPCRCRAPGIVAFAGQTVCLQLPGGGRLARCSKVLNNSAWKLLDTRCDAVT